MKAQEKGLKKGLICMKKLMTLAITMLGAVALVGACSPPSPDLLPKPDFIKEKISDKSDKLFFNPTVDVLFVVDDSGSMGSHQTKLASNIQVFFNAFTQVQFVDYHIGVITTSMQNWGSQAWGGRLTGPPFYVEKTTPNLLAALQKNIMVGTMGDSTEMHFTPVVGALTPPVENSHNAGFYRPDAHLALVFITDTDDQSSMDANSFYQFLLNLKKGDAEKLLAYGVVVPSNTTTDCERDSYEPKKIEALITLVNGSLSSKNLFGLCDVDYGLKLTELAKDLASRIRRVIQLTRPADPKTITVKYGTQVIPNDKVKGWTYEPATNSIRFGPELKLNQQAGVSLEIDFEAAVYD